MRGLVTEFNITSVEISGACSHAVSRIVRLHRVSRFLQVSRSISFSQRVQYPDLLGGSCVTKVVLHFGQDQKGPRDSLTQSLYHAFPFCQENSYQYFRTIAILRGFWYPSSMEATHMNPIIEKLRKLIAHERSARSIGNLAEAEAFAAKVQDLLTAHKLEMSEVDFQAREDGEPIDWERVDGHEINGGGSRTKVYWRVRIAKAVAKVNSCDVVNNSASRGTAFFFVGRTSDRQLAKILYLYLVELGEELVSKAVRENREIQTLKFNVRNSISDWNIPTWAKAAFARWMKDYRESWKTGFGEAIATRLLARYEETLKAQAAISSNAIVHIKRDALAVEEFLKGKTRQSRGVSASGGNLDGFAAGQRTGNAVNLSPNRFGATTGRASRLLGA